MRAVRLHEYGQTEFEVEDVEPPAMRPGDVRIAVHASSVNPIDWKIASGSQRAVVRYALPRVIGMDVSGVVTEVGPQAEGFAVGDEVYSVIDFRRPGCYAEETVIDAKHVALKPKSLSHEEAASIPLAGLTAWQSLVTSGGLQRGHRVLVQAGAGGVGSLAIQIAKNLGAEVSTTCSARNVELVTSLGADRVIDYNVEAFDEVLSDLDLVLDALGGEARDKAVGVVKRGGAVVSIVSDMAVLGRTVGPYRGLLISVGRVIKFLVGPRLGGKRTAMVVMKPSGKDLGDLGRLIDEGSIRPLIDRVVPLAELGEAFAHSRTHRARGKIVIKVR